MSKTADRLDRMEKLLEELVALMRILVLRGGNLPADDEVSDISIPPHLPPALPPAQPATPPVLPQPWQPPTLPDAKSTCGKCGMVFEGIMGYVCQDPTCPMGCGPIVVTY